MGESLDQDKIKTVLLVDDDVVLLQSLVVLLESAGNFKVFSAQNGLDGLHTLRTTSIDIVITDVKMPVMNGIEFFAQICLENIKMTVIFITGHADEDQIQTVKELGAYEIINKPFQISYLTKIINQALASKAAQK